MNKEVNVTVMTGKQAYFKPQTEVLAVQAEAMLAGSGGEGDIGDMTWGAPKRNGFTDGAMEELGRTEERSVGCLEASECK